MNSIHGSAVGALSLIQEKPISGQSGSKKGRKMGG